MVRLPDVIQVVPLGPVAHEDLMAIAASVRARFGVGCEVMPVLPMPAHAYHATRGQHDADTLLEFLFDRLQLDVMRVVGVTEKDLYAEGRNFVFGYAHMRDRVAVFSTLRLRESYWGRPENAALYRSRIDKALTHELGHTFHAPHCETPRCVMHQVEFLWQLDQLEPNYCARCTEKIRTIAGRGVHSAECLFELAGSYMRRRRFARAAAAYAAAVDRDPANAHYANDHGVALLALGEKAQAAKAFQRAIQLSPSFPHAYYNLGIVCRERGDLRTAEHFFEEAIRRDEDPRQANRYLGILHQDYFQDPAKAIAYFERFVALGGDDADVRNRLAELRRRTLRQTAPTLRVVTESTAPV